VLVVVVRVSVVAGTLTGPLGRLSAARLAVVPAAAGSCVYFPQAVRQRHADLGRERRVVGAEVPEEGVPTRLRHCDFDPPQSGRVTGAPGGGRARMRLATYELGGRRGVALLTAKGLVPTAHGDMLELIRSGANVEVGDGAQVLEGAKMLPPVPRRQGAVHWAQLRQPPAGEPQRGLPGGAVLLHQAAHRLRRSGRRHPHPPAIQRGRLRGRALGGYRARVARASSGRTRSATSSATRSSTT
jgi:hypothetical protein